MSRAKRFLPLGLAVVLMVQLLAGCGGGSKGEALQSSSGGAAQATAAASLAAPSAKPAAVSGSTASRSSSAPTDDALPALDTQRLIVRNADLALSVQNVEQALARVRQTVSDVGGFVFSSSTSSADADATATLTVQVPSDQFDGVMTALRTAPGVAKVERESVTSQDVTDEYVDLQSRQRNLEATEQQYLTLLGKATTINDTLAVERELSRVQDDLEQVKGRIQFLDQRTAYSRINLTLSPVAAATSTKPASNLESAVERAWASSLQFTGAVVRAVVTVVVFLWWFWPLAGVAAYVVLRRRPHPGRASAPTES